MEEKNYYNEKVISENSALLQLLKNSFVRIIIFVLIGVTIASSLMGLFSILFKNKNEYISKIIFSNKGIEQGMSPWGNTLDISAGIKSSNLIRNAMLNCGYNENEINILLPKVISEILVVPKFSKTNPDEEKTNIDTFMFDITLQSDLGLGEPKVLQLLTEITKEYVKEFKSAYEYKNVATTQKLDTTKYNFIQLNDIFQGGLDKSISFVNYLQEKNSNFRSTVSKHTFGELSDSLGNIKTKLVGYRSYIIENGIDVGNKNVSSGLAYMQQYKNNLEQSVAVAQDEIDFIDKQLKQAAENLFGKDGSLSGSGGGSTIIIDTGNYFRLLDKLVSKQEALGLKKYELETLTKAIDTYTISYENFSKLSNEEKEKMRNNATELYKDIENDYFEIEKLVEQSLAEFNTTVVLKNGVVAVSANIVNAIKKFSIIAFALINLIVAVVAGIAACFVTKSKMTKVAAKETTVDNSEKIESLEKASQSENEIKDKIVIKN